MLYDERIIRECFFLQAYYSFNKNRPAYNQFAGRYKIF